MKHSFVFRPGVQPKHIKLCYPENGSLTIAYPSAGIALTLLFLRGGVLSLRAADFVPSW